MFAGLFRHLTMGHTSTMICTCDRFRKSNLQNLLIVSWLFVWPLEGLFFFVRLHYCNVNVQKEMVSFPMWLNLNACEEYDTQLVEFSSTDPGFKFV